ncbi:hypothetical protein, partial [Vreelandella rituensis]
LALIFGDIVTLIGKRPHELPDQLLKSCRETVTVWPQRGSIFYAFLGGCQWAISMPSGLTSKPLTNRGFSTSFTAGNAWRSRQRMRTLPPDRDTGKSLV